MIKTSIIFMTTGLLMGNAQYETESAKINFEINSTFNGVTSSLKKHIIFDKHGEEELIEVYSPIKDKNNSKQQHTLTYHNGSILYQVDFDKKRIYRSLNYVGKPFGIVNRQGSVDEMLKIRGAKKIGTDKVVGKECDVWKNVESTDCIYKGLALRVVQKEGNVTRIESATDINLNMKLTAKDFRLPNFPVYSIDAMNPSKKQEKLDSSKLNEMDKKELKRVAKEKEIQAVADKAKKAREEKLKLERVAKRKEYQRILDEAYIKAGVDESKLTPPTDKQIEIIKAYVREAKFPESKKSLLKEGKKVLVVHQCLVKATTAKDANLCLTGKKNLYKEWNKEKQKEMQKDLEMYEKRFSCIEKLSKAKDLNGCFDESNATK